MSWLGIGVVRIVVEKVAAIGIIGKVTYSVQVVVVSIENQAVDFVDPIIKTALGLVIISRSIDIVSLVEQVNEPYYRISGI